MNLKLKDAKLLVSLFQNSRVSNRQLAKDIGVSKETVASRIEHFEDLDIIKAFSLKTNYDKLGYKEFNLYIRLKNVNSSLISKFVNYLEGHSHTTWIGKTFGKYDLRVAVIVKEYSSINDIVAQIQTNFGKNIEVIDYLYVVDKFKASSKLFLKNIFGEDVVDLISNKKKLPVSSNKKKDLVLLDSIDKNIIYELSQNPKETYAKVAVSCGLTAEAVKYRVKRLEVNEFITGNGIVLNGAKFGKIWCIVLLSINPEKMSPLKDFLKKQVFLSNYVETIGAWNMTANFFANNVEELYESLNVVRNAFSEDLHNFEFLINFEVFKFPKIPSCIKD